MEFDCFSFLLRRCHGVLSFVFDFEFIENDNDMFILFLIFFTKLPENFFEKKIEHLEAKFLILNANTLRIDKFECTNIHRYLKMFEILDTSHSMLPNLKDSTCKKRNNSFTNTFLKTFLRNSTNNFQYAYSKC